MKHRHGVRFRRLSQSQQGMASIVITMVTMVVISLIVLGFATISRREARQSLDQLQSTQAFYAAESGVEDAREIIKNLVAAGQPVPAKSNCTTNDAGVTAYPTGAAMEVDGVNNIEYTCLQIDPSPENVEFDGVDADSTVIPLNASSDIREVELSWQPQGPTGTPATCPGDIDHEFRPQSGANAWNCGYGVLRVDLVPTSGILSRAGMQTSAYGGFFQPVNFSAPGTDRYDVNTGQPKLVAANCTLASYGTCRVNITDIPNGITSMMLRVSSIYQPSDVKISALDASGDPLEISGVQAEIDVTGKSTDVLRRIKVRLPLVNTSTLFPGNAITSNGSICKRFSTTEAYLNIPAFLDPDPGNTMCQPMTDGTLGVSGGPSSIVGNASVEGPPASSGRCSTPAECIATGSYQYRQTFVNASTNPPAIVAGCRWDFGDGVLVDNVACNQGNTIRHDYPPLSPEPPYPTACITVPPRVRYNTRLTINLIDGSSYTDTRTTLIPNCF